MGAFWCPGFVWGALWWAVVCCDGGRAIGEMIGYSWPVFDTRISTIDGTEKPLDHADPGAFSMGSGGEARSPDLTIMSRAVLLKLKRLK